MLASLLLMGTGYGLYIALLGLLACLAGSNRATIGVFCIIFGVSVLGYVFKTFGYVGWGGDVIVAIGLLLLFSKFTLHTAIFKSSAGLFLIAWGVLVLMFFYFTGPQNAYSLSLLTGYLKTAFLTFVAFLIIFSDKSVNWSQLGLLGILSALIYLGAAGRIEPNALPGGIFAIGSIRLSAEQIAESGLFTHRLAFLAILGFMFIYSKNVSQSKSARDITILAIALFVTVVLIGWSGARQGLFMLMIGSGSIFLCKFEGKYRRYVVPVMAVGLLLIAFVGMGISKGVTFYTVLFDSEKSFTEKFNRSMVYDQAFIQIAEKPLFGHGLGGYHYAEKYQRGMKRTREFAHNVVLDLLVQTGLIGTAIFFVPLLLIPNYRKRFGRMRGVIHGNVILPVFIVMILRLLVDAQLLDLGAFVGVIASMDLVRQPESQGIMDKTTARSARKTPVQGNGDKWPYKRKRAF